MDTDFCDGRFLLSRVFNLFASENFLGTSSRSSDRTPHETATYQHPNMKKTIQGPKVIDDVFHRFSHGLLLASVFSAALLISNGARAATLTVTNGNDSGTGSLRQAVANATSGDTISFASSVQQINLIAPLQLNKNLILAGPGAAGLSITATQQDPNYGKVRADVFRIPQAVNVSLSGLTIIGSALAIDNSGNTTISDCVFSDNAGQFGYPGTPYPYTIPAGLGNRNQATLTLNRCRVLNSSRTINVGGNFTFSQSVITGGQGIACSGGSATITYSTISGCVADSQLAPGGGLHNEGVAAVSNSTITSNTGSRGGGVYNSGSLTLTACTISNNLASESYNGGGSGGGISNGGTLTITNCTISGNRASGGYNSQNAGGGIYSDSNFNVTITSSTIVFNNARSSGSFGGSGGGIYANNVSMKSTILALNVADNSDDGNCTIQSDGYNLIGKINGGGNGPGIFIAPQSSDQIGTNANPINPLIGSLSDNGGPTLTHALQTGSPAIDKGAPDAPTLDQRGYGRSGAPDIGAYEFNGIGTPLPTATPGVVGNISTRSFVQTGDNVIIGGVIIQAGNKKIMVRGIGPSLSAVGISNPLPDPTLELRDSSGTLLASNNDWQTTVIGGIIIASQVTDIQNSGIAPTNPKESAVIVTLAPGAYTAIVRGVNGTTGVGLVEIYGLQ
jgi:hypothetical protein